MMFLLLFQRFFTGDSETEGEQLQASTSVQDREEPEVEDLALLPITASLPPSIEPPPPAALSQAPSQRTPASVAHAESDDLLPVLHDERESNFPAASLERFREKIERQLGGSVEDPRIQGHFLLLIHRKLCQVSQEVKQLARMQPHINKDDDPPIKTLTTVEEYQDFVNKLEETSFKERVVS